MPKEIETKFKIDSPDRLRKNLKKIGARFIFKKLEKDIYYYNPTSSRALTVRLRSVGNKGIFTVKDLPGGRASRTFKVRNELEVGVDDIRRFDEMLKKLGFVPCFRKEKMRETYKWRNAKIFIDRLPHMGCYAEIEASRKRIKEIAHLLGLDIKKAIPDTYMGLFSYYKALHKKPKLELVF